jgi:dynamin 1-like protein
VSTIAATLELLSQQIAKTVFRRFPKLADQVLDLTSNIFLREREAARAVIENIVAYETGYLFTNDVRYLTDHGSMQKMIQQGQPGVPGQPGAPVQPGQPVQQPGAQLGPKAPPQLPQAVFEPPGRRGRYSGPYIGEIRARLDSYFELVLRNVRDSVPKAVGFFLVRQVQDKLQFELYTALNKAEALDDLLGEPPHIREERKQLLAQVAILDKANMVLQRDPAIAAINMEAALDMEEEPKPTAKPQAAVPGMQAGYRPPAPSVTGGFQPPAAAPPRNIFDQPSALGTRSKLPANPLFE